MKRTEKKGIERKFEKRNIKKTRLKDLEATPNQNAIAIALLGRSPRVTTTVTSFNLTGRPIKSTLGSL